MWYPISISRSQFGHFLKCGIETDELGVSLFFAFIILLFCWVSISLKILMIALSVIGLGGIRTAAWQIGHFPVFPAFDSLAVKLCPLGHLSWIVMLGSPLRANGN
ncbi:MAG: hypothetical protein LBC74_13000 [Planctomycetaceae bacterium]|jgi:hypothetical protein|nr:hypothetical protein [Planctomycetaceae bacterium]